MVIDADKIEKLKSFDTKGLIGALFLIERSRVEKTAEMLDGRDAIIDELMTRPREMLECFLDIILNDDDEDVFGL